MSVNGILTGQNTQRVKPVTSDQYDSLSSEAKAADILYAITDDEPPSDVSYSKSQVDSLVSNIKDDIAGIQATGSTNATGSTITNGTYFYLNNVLVRAIADIANDASFTLNVNYEEVTAGALNELVDSRLPKIGMGKNLLRNWYFVGGGTGRGVFPINQRGATSGTTTNNTYSIDAWKWTYTTRAGSWALNSTGLTLTPDNASDTVQMLEYLENASELNGKSITASIMRSDGTLIYGTITRDSSIPQFIVDKSDVGLRIFADGNFRIYARTTQTIVAVKLELGTEQTLAHLENGSWVLNEVPDYEEELIKCQTSTADSSDTYANKTLATEDWVSSITMQNIPLNSGYSVPSGYVARYGKSKDGFVFIEGSITHGTTDVTPPYLPFTMPEGYRPRSTITFLGKNSNHGYIVLGMIGTDGVATFFSLATGFNTTSTFNMGLSFRDIYFNVVYPT